MNVRLPLAGLVIGLAITATAGAQAVRAPVSQPAGPPGASTAQPLPKPAGPAEKQGFIRRQAGRDVNPDQPDPAANPLHAAPRPGADRTDPDDEGPAKPPMARPDPVERQGFIRRQVGRDTNPDQLPDAPLAPPTGRGGATQPEVTSSARQPQ
jgi:hypothetical protein